MGTTRLIPRAKCCGLYLPGHEVHWIQANHSNDPGETPPTSCRVLEIRDDGTVAIDLFGKPLELWSHDPVRLRALVDTGGAQCSYQERWRLLRVPSTRGAYCVDVTPASNPQRRPCPPEPRSYETPGEQLLGAGGFVVRASDLFAPVDPAPSLPSDHSCHNPVGGSKGRRDRVRRRRPAGAQSE